MKYSEFLVSVKKFNEKLKKLDKNKKSKLSECRITASDSLNCEIKIIIDRIEKELREFVKTQTTLIKLFKENKQQKLIKKLARKLIITFIKLQLDIKDFFIHTNIFLDTLHRIVKIIYGKQDETYYEFEKKMKRFDDFTKKRNQIIHMLAMVKFTNTENGKLGFDIPKSFNSTWGSKTVKSVDDFIEGTLEDLAKILDYLNQ